MLPLSKDHAHFNQSSQMKSNQIDMIKQLCASECIVRTEENENSKAHNSRTEFYG